MSNKNNGDGSNDVVSMDKTTSIWNKPVTRRAFLTVAGVGVAGTVLVAAGMQESAVKREVFLQMPRVWSSGTPRAVLGAGAVNWLAASSMMARPSRR